MTAGQKIIPMPVAQLPLADELCAVFARASGLLLSEQAVNSALRIIASLVTATVPGAVGSGISVIDGDSRRTVVASDDTVERVDDLQYRLDEGPCLTATASRVLVKVDAIDADERWPRWSPAAGACGVCSVLSAPLVAGNRCLGAMKVYSDRCDAFDEQAEHLLTLFATQAAILLGNARSTEAGERLSSALAEAVRSRDVISTATGIVMARDGVGEETALATLVAAAHREGRALREVAHGLVRSTARRRR